MHFSHYVRIALEFWLNSLSASVLHVLIFITRIYGRLRLLPLSVCDVNSFHYIALTISSSLYAGSLITSSRCVSSFSWLSCWPPSSGKSILYIYDTLLRSIILKMLCCCIIAELHRRDSAPEFTMSMATLTTVRKILYAISNKNPINVLSRSSFFHLCNRRLQWCWVWMPAAYMHLPLPWQQQQPIRE